MTGPNDSLNRPDLFATRDRPSLKGYLKSWARRVVGELLLSRYPPAPGGGRRLLNAGCGPRRFAGFVNAEFYTTRLALGQRGRRRRPDWMMDLRRPLKCHDDFWDGIFIEHVLEHLTPFDARGALREFLRTLKPGGRLRLTVPSLAIFARYYVSGDRAVLGGANRAWNHRAEAIADLTQMWGHLSVWDFELMAALLADVGFTDIREAAFGQGADPELLRDDPEKAWETLYVEARKPG